MLQSRIHGLKPKGSNSTCVQQLIVQPLAQPHLSNLLVSESSVRFCLKVTLRDLNRCLFGQSVTRSSETVPPNLRSSLEGVYVLPTGNNTNFRPMHNHGRIQIRQEGSDLVLRSRRGPWRSGFKLCMADAENPPLLTIDTGEIQPPLIVPIIDSDRSVTGLRLDQLVVMQKDPTLTTWQA